MNSLSDDDRDKRLRSVPNGRILWWYMIVLGVGIGLLSVAFGFFAVRDHRDALYGAAIFFVAPAVVILWFAWRMRAMRESDQ